MPGYTLAPQARIHQITAQIAQAVTAAAARVDGPIRLAGHSAGGHLVSRMICAGSALPPEAVARIERVVSISGLHDLRPLLLNSLNETLHLDPAEAAAESPALLEKSGATEVMAWVGARERPEFLRQSALLAEAWPGTGIEVETARHHFDVIDGLTGPDHPLCRAVAGD